MGPSSLYTLRDILLKRSAVRNGKGKDGEIRSEILRNLMYRMRILLLRPW